MFKDTATNLNTQPTMMQQIDLWLKNARLLPDGCCCLNETGNKILFRINWQRENQGFNVALYEESIGVRSSDLECQAKGPAYPFQQLLEVEMRCYWTWCASEPQPHCAETTCFSWVPTGFPPAFLVAFPPETHSKTVHWAIRVTSKAQLRSHAQCPP